MFKSLPLKKSLVVLLAVAAMASMSACSSREVGEVQSSAAPTVSPTATPEPTPEKPKDIDPPDEIVEKIDAAYGINDDVKGWITVPNTTINNEILQNTDESLELWERNLYYERRNINEEYDFHGCFFADAGNVLSVDDKLTANTIIYGHNMDDDPNGDKFSPLMNYENEEFAENNPYIYITTPEDYMVFEVFSAFFTDTDFQYHLENPSTATLQGIIDGGRDRSVFDYDVQVSAANDKILTLSTCTYRYGAWSADGNYNTAQRFVVQARLVPDSEATKTTVEVMKNTDAVQPSFGNIYTDAQLEAWGITEYK